MRAIVPTILCLVFVLTVANDARSQSPCNMAQCYEMHIIESGKSAKYELTCESTSGGDYPYAEWNNTVCVASPEVILDKCTCWPSSPTPQSPTPTFHCTNNTPNEVSVDVYLNCRPGS